MLVGSALYDKHETGVACIAQAKLYKMCMLHGFGVCFAHISRTYVASKLVQCVKKRLLLAADLPQKGYNMVSLHREPCLKSSLIDGFP